MEAGQWFEKAGLCSEAARCYEQSGNYAKAALCYEQAGMLPAAGRLYERAGNIHDATRCYQKYSQKLAAKLGWHQAVAEAERLVQVGELPFEDAHLLIALYRRLKAGQSYTVDSNDGSGAIVGGGLGAAIGGLLLGPIGMLLGGLLGATAGSAGSSTSRTVTLEAVHQLLAKIEAKLAQHGYDVTQ